MEVISCLQKGDVLEITLHRPQKLNAFNDELIDLISSQSDEQAKGKSITDLERIRDDNLVEIQKALEKNNYGAGTLIKKAKETFETL